MDQYEILAKLGLALAIGFLIGIERGWREREEGEGERTAGLRTFALIGLSGGLWAALSQTLGPLPLAVGFLATAAAFAFFRWRELEREGSFGATTIVAAFLTFALGAYAVVGDRTAAAAAAVATTVLLAAKGWLHGWVKAISWEELRATLILLAMSFIALPILPDRFYGPYGALNPHDLWLMTIAIAGVSFIGYVAVKVAGTRYGVLLGGVAGGLVSSTATTVDLARRARSAPATTRLQLAGALAASAVMFFRVLFIVAMFGPALLAELAGPIAVGGLVLIGAALVLDAPWAAVRSGEKALVVTNPFDLRLVVGFAALLALILILSKVLIANLGGEGGIVLGAVAGLADVDAITLSMTQVPAGATLSEAETAILVAVAANSVSKSVLAAALGGRRFALGYVAATVAALTAGAAVAFAQGA